MDVDSPDCVTQYLDLKEETLERFCKDAARAFFSEFGLINHQINSFNQFITSGLQEIFDSLGEVVVEPGYDPSKGGGGDWQHATITYGKVRLGKPTFWTERSGQETEELKLLPKHARLQNMTYSSKLKVEVRVQVYILEKSDKAKTGKDSHICKRVLSDDKKEITIGSMPVMVKSKLCWLDTLDKSDCLYDSGGYFIVKGAEKQALTLVFVETKKGADSLEHWLCMN
ncbi:DNA-directed RNA polymerases IV and V subunit 2-like isoform X2 [Asparagus officinalis]|uniref:DNA-directed RNA polymerases IV and V subunit 2-like isoform X2 n=1 Tax=Asparagus officinalis TaxID=4686 RepID=UPI00098E4B69|nr:DNA-directed RNA polymerases IV and V subunit 2-like isoform X2 [Asparagus officinalis]